MFLLASGTINQKTYAKLMEIKEARNRLAHDSFEAMKISLVKVSPESKEAKDAKSIIKKAIYCLKMISPPVIP